MFVIGVTGGIASGKSNVVKNLAKLGARVLDADLIGHSVYAPKSKGFYEVVNLFGERVVASDGTINRKELGNIVFSNPNELKKLNNLMWPLISERIKEEFNIWRKEGKTKIAVLEAAVLIEAGWKHVVDSIWVTIVNQEVAIERLISRNKLSKDEALARIQSQISNAERLAHAHEVIDTSGTFSQTQEIIERKWNLLNEKLNKSKL